MNAELIIGGNSYEFESMSREAHLVAPCGTWRARVGSCPESLWSDVTIKEGGETVLTGYMLSKTDDRESGLINVSGTDTYTMVKETFLDEEEITSSGSSVGNYIDYLMLKTGLNYSYPATAATQGVEPDIQIGPGSVHDAITNIIRYAALYVWVEPDGEVVFGTITNESQHIVPDFISHEKEIGDEYTRHTIKVFGYGTAVGIAEGDMLGDPVERIGVIDSPFIMTNYDAEQVAIAALATYNEHDDVRTVVLPGDYGSWKIPEMVTDDGDALPITSIYSSVSKSGHITKFILNERSPLYIGQTITPAAVVWPPHGYGPGIEILLRASVQDPYYTYGPTWQWYQIWRSGNIVSSTFASMEEPSIQTFFPSDDYDSIEVDPFDPSYLYILKTAPYPDVPSQTYPTGAYLGLNQIYGDIKTKLIDAAEIESVLGLAAGTIRMVALRCDHQNELKIWLVVWDGSTTYVIKTDNQFTTWVSVGSVSGQAVNGYVHIGYNAIYFSLARGNTIYRADDYGVSSIGSAAIGNDIANLICVPRGTWNEDCSVQYAAHNIYNDDDELTERRLIRTTDSWATYFDVTPPGHDTANYVFYGVSGDEGVIAALTYKSYMSMGYLYYDKKLHVHDGSSWSTSNIGDDRRPPGGVAMNSNTGRVYVSLGAAISSNAGQYIVIYSDSYGASWTAGANGPTWPYRLSTRSLVIGDLYAAA